MSEGTDAYANQIKDKNRIGREYSASDTEPATYTFFIKGEKVGLKVRRVKGKTRSTSGKNVWSNMMTWGVDSWSWNPFILGNTSGTLGSSLGKLGGEFGNWVTVFEIFDPE